MDSKNRTPTKSKPKRKVKDIADSKVSKESTTSFIKSPEERKEYLQKMVKSLPESVQERISKLKQLQVEQIKVERKFNTKRYELEKKYHKMFSKLYEDRRAIISGEVDPPQERPVMWREPTFPPDHVSEFTEDLEKFKRIPENTKGLPNFWLMLFDNTDMISQLIEPHDRCALRKLTDVRLRHNDDKEQSFTLLFYFDKNDYFTNSVLKKTYVLANRICKSTPFEYEGYGIERCKGCRIHWKDHMNLTYKKVLKKKKNKTTGRSHIYLIKKLQPSFFNFFSPPKYSDSLEMTESDYEVSEMLESDKEIGLFFRNEIIPKAVLYLTGDLVQPKEEDDESEFDDLIDPNDLDADDDGNEEDDDDDENENENDDNSCKDLPIPYGLRKHRSFWM